MTLSSPQGWATQNGDEEVRRTAEDAMHEQMTAANESPKAAEKPSAACASAAL